MRPCSLALGLLLFLAVPLNGQTILNTERFQLAEVDGFHFSGDLSANLQRGNNRILDVKTAGIVGTLDGRHWPRLIFGGRYLSRRDDSLLDEQFVQARYSYILSPNSRTFHFVQAQKNETLLLRSRWLVGSGVRKTFVRSGDVSLSAGTGLMGEWERLNQSALGPDDEQRLRALRMANVAVASLELDSGARVLNILYLQPDVTDFGDLRILNELALLVPVTSWIRATVALEWRRDTRPPSTLKKDDAQLRMGLGVDFH
jgi:hypothetical protein